MALLLPSIPYPPSTTQYGYWGPVTSTIDWCEENYYATHYIAELINSTTNLMFMYLGIRGIRSCLRNGHDTVFIIGYIAYLMIGTGSFWFHATLNYSMQLVDEVSMLWTSSVLVYALFSHGATPQVKWTLGMGITALVVGLSGYYFYLEDPRFHQAVFTLITLLVVVRGVYLMEVTLRPRWRRVVAAVQGRPERWTNGHGAVIRARKKYDEMLKKDESDLRMLEGMYLMMGYGLVCCLAGFLLWTGDRVYCSSLRQWRREVGMPWGFMLEGHGWWHILTGIAGYYNLAWNIWMRYGLYGRNDEIEVVWPSLVFSVPEIIKKEKVKGQ